MMGRVRRILGRVCTPIFLEAFVLTFLAEWGSEPDHDDRVGGAQEPLRAWPSGGTIGHAFCTGLAVVVG